MRILAVAVGLCLLALPLAAQPSCPTPQIIQTAGGNPTCPGVPVTLDAGAGWASYHWSNGATTRFLTDSPSQSTSYFVTTTDANGCSATSQPFPVGVSNVDALAISFGSSPLCSSEQGHAYDNTIYPHYSTRQWSLTNAVLDTDYGSSIAFHPTGEGDVTVTLNVVDWAGCPISTSATLPVRIIDPPVIRRYDTSVCPGSTSGAYIDPPRPDRQTSWQSVQWSIVNGTIGYQSGSFVNFQTDPGGAAATLTVTATDTHGCTSTASTTVPVRSIPPPVIHPYDASICPGSTSGAYIDPPEDQYVTWQNVQWTIANGTIGYQSGGFVNFQSSPNGQPVSLTVVVTDSRGCSNTGHVTIPVRSIPPPVIHPYDVSICPGSTSGAYIDPPEDQYATWQNVQWTIANGTIGYQSG
ncbi:MAG TPA: hypothetical protein VJZ76_19705, partial [Thermoanaerobaculia bacterium]|nr:hypothetical protein [Thermoanaerobaculia bacterium]